MNSTPHPFASPSVKYSPPLQKDGYQISINLVTRPY